MMTMEKLKEFDTRHGGPYDRGSADAYYRRKFEPHYFKGDTHSSEIVYLNDPCSHDYEAYKAGYQEQVESGEFKDWG
jgi:hypothetical protein